MATSSLFHSFEFSGEAAGRFARAIEESWRECEEAKKRPKPDLNCTFVDDPEEIKAMDELWEKNYGHRHED